MKLTKAFLSASALVALVAFSAFAGTASAAAPRQTSPNQNQANPSLPRPVRFVGLVSSVNSRGIQLNARAGVTVTALANSDTWILVEQNGSCTQGTLSDIQTGQRAAVAGMSTNQRGVVNARVINQCRAGDAAAAAKGAPGNAQARQKAAQQLAKHVGAGTVKSITGSTVTVTTLKGQDLTVNTTASTAVLSNGFTTVSTLKVGDKVEVFGKPDKSAAPPAGGGSTPAAGRTITALAIHVSNSTTLMVGRVDSVNGNTVTLKTPKHRDGVQVTFGSKVGFKTVTVVNQQATLSNATQADVKAGSNLIVEGVASADGKSFTASAVIILPGGKVK